MVTNQGIKYRSKNGILMDIEDELAARLKRTDLVAGNNIVFNANGERITIDAPNLKSAYDIWLEQGNTGTAQDFLNSLKGSDGKNGTNGIDGKDGQSTFDRVIRTNEELAELIALSGANSWNVESNGIHSVAFVGEISITAPQGIKIPIWVTNIHGFNNAVLNIDGLKGTGDNYIEGGLRYAAVPEIYESKYSIRDLSVNATAVDGFGNAAAFRNCVNLVNCRGKGSGRLSSPSGFCDCKNLVNCVGIADCSNTSGYYYGFRRCNNLVNCFGEIIGTGGGTLLCFDECNDLSNCTARIQSSQTGSPHYGFADCRGLVNCKGAINTGGSGGKAIFRSCSYLSNCGLDSNASNIADIWSGTNTYRDDDSCQI